MPNHLSPLRVALVAALLFAPRIALPQEATPEAARKEVPPRRTFTVGGASGAAEASGAIVVDGILDDEGWKAAAVIDLPYEYFPGDNVPPPVRTECLVTYDTSNLYLAFRAHDPEPSRVRAHLADRDSITTFQQDDHVGFILDLFNDERRGFQFRVNPLGVQADAVFSELDGIEDFSWDAIWTSAGKINAEGWAVEVAIPFNQLRFPRTSGVRTWGLDAFRSYPRSFRHRISSSYQDRNRSCLLCQAAKITGLEGISPGRNLELAPTLTGHRTDRRPDFPAGSLGKDDQGGDFGLSARWGITPNLTLNATVNPDFSQVEADVAQLDVNNRFALFFPEKRPFFLEGIDFFATPLQTVFTRTVTDPAGGLKVTGKSGRSALGVFLARDEVNNLILPSNQTSDFATVDQRVTSGVFRYRHDVGSGSTVGFLYSGREGEGYHNRLGGVDAFVRASARDTFRVQYLRSSTEYPETVVEGNGQAAGTLEDFGLFADYTRLSDRWQFFAQYQDLGRGFRADSGFIPRVDVRTLQGNLTRVLRGQAGKWYSQINLGLQGLRTQDHDGRRTDQSVALDVIYNGPRQSVLQLTAFHDQTLFDGVSYGLNRLQVQGELRPTGNVRLNFTGEVGDAIDFVNSRPAEGLRVGPSVEYRLGRHLELRLGHDLQRLSVSGGRLVTANLTQGRVVYHFGTRAFLRTILQYRDTDRSVPLFLTPVEDKSRRLFSQFLFSYKVNPQTVLLVGYSDNAAGNRQLDLTRSDRSFFLKVGYAWVP